MGMYLVLILALAAISGGVAEESSTLVPAILTFGDSAVNVGNNDYLHTIFKANYPPYGRDFPNHKPTGRFCNGELATDITAETLGPASGKKLLIDKTGYPHIYQDHWAP